MGRQFNELVEKMPVEARERAEAKAEKLIAEYALLADILGKDQSVISRIEKRTDMYVSTLAELLRDSGAGSGRRDEYAPLRERVQDRRNRLPHL